jgi:serine/threonine protein kinase
MDSGELIARFETERQPLAMMDHPNIARIYDGGTTDTGRPYFVMELVRGIPVTNYCDEARLTTETPGDWWRIAGLYERAGRGPDADRFFEQALQ